MFTSGHTLCKLPNAAASVIVTEWNKISYLDFPVFLTNWAYFLFSLPVNHYTEVPIDLK